MDKRAKKIIKIRDIKGRSTFEDLQIIPNITSSIWDPLVEEGLVNVPSTVNKISNSYRKYSKSRHFTKSNNEKCLEREREVSMKEKMTKERKSWIIDRENIIQEKDLTIKTKKKNYPSYRKVLKQRCYQRIRERDRKK